MRNCTLPGDTPVPALGLGTWRMGESDGRKSVEVAALRNAIAIGYRLIDTAEMYGEGGAETIVGEAVTAALRAGELRREDLFLVSKVYPHNASAMGTGAACDRSRARLGLDCIDLYLLHWRGQIALRETCEAFLRLIEAGAIRRWGVSNFDTADLQELRTVELQLGIDGDDARRCAVNQLYYSLSTRGPEFSLLPLLAQRGIATMAYSPIDQGALAADPVLRAIGARRKASAAQVALAWVLGRENVIAIPKAVREAHLRENWDAAQLKLGEPDRREIEQRFAPPRHKRPLDML